MTPTSKPPTQKQEKPTRKTLHIRLTPDERAALERQADEAGTSMADVLRSFIGSARTRNRRVNKADIRRLNIEVRKIGINLNQLARWANTHKGSAETSIVLARLLKLEAAIESLQSVALGEKGEKGDADQVS